jgi:hypothetical protein
MFCGNGAGTHYVAIWVLLVFAFSSLWFAHYRTAALGASQKNNALSQDLASAAAIDATLVSHAIHGRLLSPHCVLRRSC